VGAFPSHCFEHFLAAGFIEGVGAVFFKGKNDLLIIKNENIQITTGNPSQTTTEKAAATTG
jgi:hypothetical protein